MPPSKTNKYKIESNDIISDKGARTKLLITKNTSTSKGQVGDLTSTSKQLIVKLIEHGNNNINDLLHNEVVNKFVKSHIRDQAHSTAKNILGNIYNNTYNASKPSPQQSHADRPTISREKVHLNHT